MLCRLGAETYLHAQVQVVGDANHCVSTQPSAYWACQARCTITHQHGYDSQLRTVCILKVVATLPLQGKVVQEADNELALFPDLHSCGEPSAPCTSLHQYTCDPLRGMSSVSAQKRRL